MKTAVLLCLVSISAVVLAKPNPLFEDDDYLEELHAAVFGVHQNETITPKVEDSDRANHTSEEVAYSHSYEHDDHHHQDDDDDGDDFSHEDCDHSEESIESEERHSTPLPQEDIHSSINEQGTWIEH